MSSSRQRGSFAVTGVVVRRGRERRGAISPSGFQRFEDILDADPEMDRQLSRCRWPSTFAGQEVDRVAKVDMEVLHASRNLERPRRVAEMAAELTHHRRDRVACERDTDVGIESLDCFQQAELADLNEVVERLTPMREPPSAVDGDPAMLFDQFVAQVAIAGRAPPAESLVGRLLCSFSPRILV